MSQFANQVQASAAQHGLLLRSFRGGRFIEDLVSFTKTYGPVYASLQTDGSGIVFSAGNTDSVSFEDAHALARLRMLCGALAMRVRRNGKMINPYGDHGEMCFSSTDGAVSTIQLDFMNTTREQWFRIQPVQTPEANGLK